MLGYINDCIEKFVVEEYGLEVWHLLKAKAGVEEKDGGFVKLEKYSDQSTIALATAASEELGVPVDEVIEQAGKYFVHYIGREGFESIMSAQGSTLFDWLCNINSVHSHLKMTFPNKMKVPEFWCEEEDDGALTLHHHSKRGSYLAPLGAGIVKEASKVLFGLDISMVMTQKQGRSSKFSSWRIATSDPSDLIKLRTNAADFESGSQRRYSIPQTSIINENPCVVEQRCPMSGLVFTVPSPVSDASKITQEAGASAGCPMSVENKSNTMSRTASSTTLQTYDVSYYDENGLSGAMTAKLFPYHIRIDEHFMICGHGSLLHKIINDGDIVGRYVNDLVQFRSPLSAQWTSTWMRKLENHFFKVAVARSALDIVQPYAKFTASLVRVNQTPAQIMIILNPDVNKLHDLENLNLTLSDLPVHGALRESLLLGEHLSSQMNNTMKLEKMKQTLEREKSLLEALLPEHAAEGLRTGKAVEPRLHENVSLFFSDIVNFTNICSSLQPAEVIGLLNRLYSVMDFLAIKFDLFKVETIGDAYFCASGLPDANENHARNIANFAIAVRHCCRLVRIPKTEESLQLRIGVHSGSCASGVVGDLNPRYCVFGDAVNTTSRFESTGQAGLIHGSPELTDHLLQYNGQYCLIERGEVDMKGKGWLQTFWIDAGPENEFVNSEALEKIDEEVLRILGRDKFECTTSHRASQVFSREERNDEKRMERGHKDQSETTAEQSTVSSSRRKPTAKRLSNPRLFL